MYSSIGQMRTHGNLSDWYAGSYYSAAVFGPEQVGYGGQAIELFSYGRSQQIAGSTKTATKVHTNIPRGGWNGLPKSYEFVMAGWRARTNHDPNDPHLKEFFANTTLEFVYNSRTRPGYNDTILAVLDKDEPRQIKLPDAIEMLSQNPVRLEALQAKMGMHVVHMYENLSYSVRLETQSRSGCEAIDTYLKQLPWRANPYPVVLWVYLDGIMKCPVF